MEKNIIKGQGTENNLADSIVEGLLSQDLLKKKLSTQKYPNMYEVILLNDSYTPMDFVVLVVKKFFSKDDNEAVSIMMQTHTQGQGNCGIFTRDVAETKMIQVVEFSRNNNYPLKCIIRKNR